MGSRHFFAWGSMVSVVYVNFFGVFLWGICTCMCMCACACVCACMRMRVYACVIPFADAEYNTHKSKVYLYGVLG